MSDVCCRRVAIFLGILAGCVGGSSVARAEEPAADRLGASPAEVLEAFVGAEFAGEIDTRAKLAVFSPGSRVGRLSREHPEWLDGEIVSLACDALVLVERYEVGEVSIRAQGVAVGEVKFEVVGATKGSGCPKRSIVPRKPELRTVTYRLRNEEGKWRVSDPSLPHVSTERVRTALEAERDAMLDVVRDPRASPAQRRIFEYYRAEAAKLRGMNPPPVGR